MKIVKKIFLIVLLLGGIGLLIYYYFFYGAYLYSKSYNYYYGKIYSKLNPAYGFHGLYKFRNIRLIKSYWQGSEYSDQVTKARHYINKYKSNFPNGSRIPSINLMLSEYSVIDLISNPKIDTRTEFEEFFRHRHYLSEMGSVALFLVAEKNIRNGLLMRQHNPPSKHMLQIMQCGLEKNKPFTVNMKKYLIANGDYILQVSDKELNSVALKYGWIPVKKATKNSMFLKASIQKILLDKKTYSGIMTDGSGGNTRVVTLTKKRFKMILVFQLYKNREKIWESKKYSTIDDPLPKILDITARGEDLYTDYASKTESDLIVKSIVNITIPKLRSNREPMTTCEFTITNCSNYYNHMAYMLSEEKIAYSLRKEYQDILLNCKDPQVISNVKSMHDGAFHEIKW